METVGLCRLKKFQFRRKDCLDRAIERFGRSRRRRNRRGRGREERSRSKVELQMMEP